MAKVNLKFYPRLDKTNKKSQKTPMYLRVCSQNKKSERRLPVDLTSEELLHWSDITQRCNVKDSNVNRFLNKYEKEFEDLKYALGGKLETSLPQEIINLITGRNNQKKESMTDYFKWIYGNKTLKDEDKSSGTIKNYEKALNHFTRFLEYEKLSDMSFSEMNRNIGESFWEYLLSSDPIFGKKKMTPISARGYVKKIKTYFSYSIRKGKVSFNPFDGLKMNARSPRKEKITSLQLKRLFLNNWSTNPRLAQTADIFKFCLLTGLSSGDAMALTNTNLQIFSECKVYLLGKRQKTKQPFRQFLVTYAIDIIEKYKQCPKTSTTPFLLPQLSNQECNKWLKIIAVALRIPFNLTTHSGRHGFRVMLNEAKITDHAVRKTMMGQSLNADIDGVYNEVRENELFEAKCLYENFLSSLFINTLHITSDI